MNTNMKTILVGLSVVVVILITVSMTACNPEEVVEKVVIEKASNKVEEVKENLPELDKVIEEIPNNVKRGE